MVDILRPADESEWHDVRRQYITGSDAPVIIGVGYEDPYTRWAKKTGKMPDTGDKLRFRVGHALEPLIHSELEERRGVTLFDPGDMTVFVADNGWQAATLDRLILKDGAGEADMLIADDMEAVSGIAQFKTVGQFRTGDWEGGPDEYTWIQVLHEMAVAGVEWGVAAALLGLGDWADFDIHHDEDMLEALLEAEHKFYQQVTQDIPPPLGGESSKAAINAIYGRVDLGKTVFLPPAGGWPEKAGAWDEAKAHQKEAKAALKVAENHLAVIENELKVALGDGERLEVEGVAGAFTWKETPATDISYTRKAFRTWRRTKK